MRAICNNWEFTKVCTDSFLKGDVRVGERTCPDNPASTVEAIRIPHTVAEMPLQYGDSSTYEMISGYRTRLRILCRADMQYIVHFEGAAHIAEVFVNGRGVMIHRCGYTEFKIDITKYLKASAAYQKAQSQSGGSPDEPVPAECLLAVRLDSTENPSVPPFGFVIDYLTYGGIYRPVLLEERPETSIDDVFVTTPDLRTVRIEALVSGISQQTQETGSAAASDNDFTCTAEIIDASGSVVQRGRLAVSKYTNISKQTEYLAVLHVDSPRLWSCEDPYLYTLRVSLHDDTLFKSVHEVNIRFGIRTAEFRPDGFFLNGTRVFLRGLNRHQNFPYIGYAATESLQRLDAEILKNELRVNAVRTSHYPQSQSFINACDELGLLVFTEIPGWQHISEDPHWRNEAVLNTTDMVLQYRNHPSVILWGVRINESVDCDELYTLTNKFAHQLDPSRATSGVRYLENSHLLEDVYAFNDFSYSGEYIHEAPSRKKPAAKPKRKVMKKNPDKPLLISECNGHMFPTKPWDTWARREEHALRHARVLNDAIADGKHVGCFEWCMFDYPTHKDFGSGDRVCYHGVTDCFRNPKLAAAVWSSQGEPSGENVVLEVSSNMDIGDYNAGRLEQCYVFTNADSVRLYKNDVFVTELKPSDYKALPHGPLRVDDTIGCLLTTEEGFTGRKEKLLHKALVAAARYGIAALPLPDLLRMGWCMLHYGLSYSDGVRLYSKYVGNWGGEAVVWRFDAMLNGRVAASLKRSPSERLRLEVRVNRHEPILSPLAGAPTGTDSPDCGSPHPGCLTSGGNEEACVYTLHEGDIYDMALIRVRLVDEYGSPAVYAAVPVTLTIDGCPASDRITAVGPTVSVSQGGATGFILRTTGAAGRTTISIKCCHTEPVSITFITEGNRTDPNQF